MEFPVTVESQAAFDELVKDRIARERAKFADYDDLKTSATTAEAAKAAAEQALAEAVTRAETAEGKVTEFETKAQVDTWRSEVAKEAGVPAEALRGTTKEEFEAHAETLKPLLTAASTAVVPTAPNAGRTPPTPPAPSDEAAFAAELFGSGE